jgi:predicted ferric reductase
LLILAAAVSARAGWISIPVARPDTPVLWQASRAAGFAAYAALSAEVLLGLFLSTAVADRWIARPRAVELHRWLSAVALGLTGAHALALVGDRFVRFDVLDVLVPFLAPYRPAAVGVGGLAAYGAAAVHVSFRLRSRIGARAWRALHFLSFGAYAGATAHGLLAGTDAALPWARAVYAASAGLVLWLVLHQAGAALARQWQAARRASQVDMPAAPAIIGRDA